MCGRAGEVEGFGLIADGMKPFLQQNMLQFFQYCGLPFACCAAFDCHICSGWWTGKEHTMCELLLGDAHHLVNALFADTTFIPNVPQYDPA